MMPGKDDEFKPSASASASAAASSTQQAEEDTKIKERNKLSAAALKHNNEMFDSGTALNDYPPQLIVSKQQQQQQQQCSGVVAVPGIMLTSSMTPTMLEPSYRSLAVGQSTAAHENDIAAAAAAVTGKPQQLLLAAAVTESGQELVEFEDHQSKRLIKEQQKLAEPSYRSLAVGQPTTAHENEIAAAAAAAVTGKPQQLLLAAAVTESGQELVEFEDHQSERLIKEQQKLAEEQDNHDHHHNHNYQRQVPIQSLRGPEGGSETSFGDVSLKSSEFNPKTSDHSNTSNFADGVVGGLAIVAELAVDTEAIEQERDDLKRQLDEARHAARGSLVPVVTAVREPSEPTLQIQSKSKHKFLWIAVLSVVIVVGAVVGIVVGGGGGGGGGDSTGPPQFFDQVGKPIDGPNEDEEFGSSISLNQDGTKFAVADSGAVYIYKFESDIWVPQGAPIAPLDCGTSVDSKDSLAIRFNILVDLSRNGKIVAIGCPFSNHVLDDGTTEDFTGRVELYKNVGDDWELVGSPIYGKQANSFFGGTVSLSGTGGILVIGSPGSEVGVSAWAINAGDWIQFGNSIDTTSMLLSVASLSLSTDGKVMAVGGAPLEGGDFVVRIFRFVLGEWEDMGSGIVGNLQDTSYLCDLSGNGQVVAVSNYYVGNAGPAQGGLNDALDVRAFEWSEAANEWVLLGENFHSSAPGEKSGYFISLSDDGMLIGMGDPGRRIDAGAVAGHSHIYYWTGERWDQLGPNQDGESAGDQCGFGVSFSSDGSRFAVAAPLSRGKGYEHGRVYVYDIDIERYLN